jgi:hypothetical protein
VLIVRVVVVDVVEVVTVVATVATVVETAVVEVAVVTAVTGKVVVWVLLVTFLFVPADVLFRVSVARGLVTGSVRYVTGAEPSTATVEVFSSITNTITAVVKRTAIELKMPIIMLIFEDKIIPLI